MSVVNRAIETSGTIDAKGRLVLDDPLPVAGPVQVRVIVLIPGEPDLNKAAWLRAAATNPTFDFLKDPAEDIYSIQDGQPFRDPGQETGFLPKNPVSSHP